MTSRKAQMTFAQRTNDNKMTGRQAQMTFAQRTNDVCEANQ